VNERWEAPVNLLQRWKHLKVKEEKINIQKNPYQHLKDNLSIYFEALYVKNSQSLKCILLNGKANTGGNKQMAKSIQILCFNIMTHKNNKMCKKNVFICTNARYALKLWSFSTKEYTEICLKFSKFE